MFFLSAVMDVIRRFAGEVERALPPRVGLVFRVGLPGWRGGDVECDMWWVAGAEDPSL